MSKILQTCDIFGGDYGKYDKGMLPQVQTAVNEVVGDHYVGREKEVVVFLLTYLIYCFVALNDDTFMTNHSLSSGTWLTAIYNSFINRTYTGMWFHRQLPLLKPKDFYDIVIDNVYGDDKLVGIRKHPDLLNNFTFAAFCKTIGLDYTGDDKLPVSRPFDTLFDSVTFLKRTFHYHRDIGKVVCPLIPETLYSTVNWVDSTKDVDGVLQDKLKNFQRELFLHCEKRSYLTEAIGYCKQVEERGIVFPLLSYDYLLNLFTKDIHAFIDPLMSGYYYNNANDII
jgi:hypothetical protein